MLRTETSRAASMGTVSVRHWRIRSCMSRKAAFV